MIPMPAMIMTPMYGLNVSPHYLLALGNKSTKPLSDQVGILNFSTWFMKNIHFEQKKIK